MHKGAKAEILKQQMRNKADYAKRHSQGPSYDFVVGQEVYERVSATRKNKLGADFVGPYCIVRFKEDSKRTAILEVPGKGMRQRLTRMLIPADVLPSVQRNFSKEMKDGLEKQLDEVE